MMAPHPHQVMIVIGHCCRTLDAAIDAGTVKITAYSSPGNSDETADNTCNALLFPAGHKFGEIHTTSASARCDSA